MMKIGKHGKTLPPAPRPEEQHRSTPQESLNVGVLKFSHKTKIKNLRHRQGTFKFLTETGDTNVIDCSSVRAH